MFNLGTKYLNKAKVEKALSCFKSAVKTHPCKEVYLNMGNCYRLKDDLVKAKECYLLAADTNVPYLGFSKFGEYELALTNLGLLEYARGNDKEAAIYYERALAINPKHYDAIWNYASVMLRQFSNAEPVDIDVAWKMYDFRFQRANPTPLQNILPWWDGLTRGDSIVVLAEQGIGDKLQFSRYIHLLRDYFDKIWIQSPKVLWCLYPDNYLMCEDVTKTDATVAIPICNLAKVFGWDSAPAAWLSAKVNAFEFPKSSKMNIGVVYEGSATHANTRNRNCLPTYFANLDANIFCLTPGARKIKGITNLDPKDWESTCAYVLGLDLIISVDTSIVHLAGSLGKTAWVLQPLNETDFRWGHGTKSIWYPTHRVFPNPSNWDKVFSDVRSALEPLAKEHDTKYMLGGYCIREYVEKFVEARGEYIV